MFKFSISKLISTFFYVGFSKMCPGTFGSIATLPLWFFICYCLSKLNLSDNSAILVTILISILILIYIVGVVTTKIYMEETKKSDPSEVVIDEVLGQLITFIMSSTLIYMYSYKITAIMNCKCNYLKNGLVLLLMVTPIIFFRIFDILKPYPIGYIDKNMDNANGVMLDDVVAGIFAGFCNTGLIYLFLSLVKA